MNTRGRGSPSPGAWVASRLALLLIAGLAGEPCSYTEPHLHLFRLDLAREHQTIEGFGTSITTWIPELVALYDGPEFPRFYLEQLGASVLRIDLWHGSAPVETARWEDISRRDFSLEGSGERGGTFVRTAERLHRHSRGKIRIIASVWSPPGWMKINGSAGNGNAARQNYGLSEADLRGAPPASAGDDRQTYLHQNKLRPDRYHHFAKLLVEWTRFFRERGVPLYALSPQNEPRFSHWFGSAVYTPTELAELVRVVVWMFDHEREPMPRLFGPETMTGDTEGNQMYLEALFAKPNVGERMHALASHGYVDGYETERAPEAALAFRRLAAPYGKVLWATEGGTGAHGWPAALHELGASLFNSLARGDAALVAPWQVVTGTADTHSLMPLGGPTKKTFVAMQFFRFIRPGMRRVEVVAAAPGPSVVGFRDPESSALVVVVLNRSPRPTTTRFSVLDGRPYRIRASYLTDRGHDCSLVERGPALASIAVPGEAVLTLLLEPERT